MAEFRTTINTALAQAAIPGARLVTRYVPALRRRVYRGFIEPSLAWRDYDFSVRTHFGATVRGNIRDVIQRYIYFFGCWAPQVEQLISARLRPGDTFLDVGANIGYYTLLASKLVGERGRVVGVEACSAIFNRLQGHVEMCGATNVRLLNMAASDSEGTVDLYLASEGNIGATSMVRATDTRERVACARLDSLLSAEESRSIRLIKMDVEGAEASVVKGMDKVLQAAPESAELIVELMPEMGGADWIWQRMKQAGFNAYAIPPDTLENYFRPQDYAASRLSGPPLTITDILFSRVDAEQIRYGAAQRF